MELLAVSAGFHPRINSRSWRETAWRGRLLRDRLLKYSRPAARWCEHENRVGREKRFRNYQPSIALSSRVRSSHCARRCATRCLELDHEARQARHALGAHRIALVGQSPRGRPARSRTARAAHRRAAAGGDPWRTSQLTVRCRTTRRGSVRPACACRSVRDRKYLLESHTRETRLVQPRRPSCDAVDNSRKLACVPVVPFKPAKPQRGKRLQLLGRRARNPASQRHALADRRELRRLECVYAAGEAGGAGPLAIANEDRAMRPRAAASPSRMSTRSALSVTNALVAPR